MSRTDTNGRRSGRGKAPFLIGAALVALAALFVLPASESPIEARSGRNAVPSPTGAWATARSNASRAAMPARKQRVKGHIRLDAPDQFGLLHRAIRTRQGDQGPAYPTNHRMVELLKARRAWAGKGASDPLPWVERGPGNVAGRARDILVDPDDASSRTWFVGSASGGVWKTEEAGLTWTELTRDLPNLATTSLAMSNANTNVIFAGTGEGFGTFAFVYGQGIWKSEDKGQTWTQLASTANDPAFTNIMRLIVDPNDENTIVAATSTGARRDGGETSYLYRSTDGGATWTQTYSSPVDQGFGRIEHVVAAPTDFDIQYAAVNALEVVRSGDGGATWDFTEFLPAFGGRMELAVGNTDPDLVYVATESLDGSVLQMSEDGGATWIIAADRAGVNPNWLGGQGFYDNTIAVHPYREDVVFVGGINLFRIEVGTDTGMVGSISDIEENGTDAFMGLLDLGGGAIVLTGPEWAGRAQAENTVTASEIVSVEVRFGPGRSQKAHRLTSPDGFSMDYEDYVDAPFEVWTADGSQQLMAAFFDLDGNGAWDLSEAGEAVPQDLLVIAEPYDDAAPHAATTQNPLVRLLFFMAPIGTSGSVDTANLPDSNVRINTETQVARLAAFEPVTDGYEEFGGNPKGVHVDHHMIRLVPTDPANETFLFLNANDGGIAFSNDHADTFTQTGETFSQLDGGGGTTNTPLRGLNTTQFYGADKMNGADRFVGGTQDNGSWVSPVDPDVSHTWIQAPSGDGFEAAWHYAEPDWIIETSQFNSLLRSTDGGATWQDISPPGEGPFLSRIGKSNQDPDLIFAVNSDGVARSGDFGSTWEQIPMPSGWTLDSPGGNATVRISLASPEVVWAGTQMTASSPLYVSTDGGLSFAETQVFQDATMGTITDIVTHPANPNTAFALFSFSGAPKVLRTTDLGQSWEDISGFGSGSSSTNGFPDVATYSLVVMPDDPDKLWVGTEIGLWESTDGGGSWTYLDSGLPAVAVWQMRIVNDQVVAATHGRGIWTVALPGLAGYEPPAVELPPVISMLEGGLGGILDIAVQTRSDHDSTVVFVDQQRVHTFGASTSRQVLSATLILTITATQTVSVEAVGYTGGQAAHSAARTVTLAALSQAQASFSTDFEDAAGSFLLDGFSIVTADGFADPALHTDHPYADNANLTALLTTPMIVASQDAVLTYDDVAFVEPGTDGVPFGEADFFDYVVVEGSADQGGTWQPLADGYDFRFDEDWLAVSGPTAVGEPSFFVSHEIDLLNTFSAGQEILIRFRLFSDDFANGWGWVVDNLEIQTSAPTNVGQGSDLPAVFELAQNYPNPFNPRTTISYLLPRAAPVTLNVYNIAGQLVRTLVDADQAPGSYQVVWDGRTSAGTPVSSGVYLYQMRAGLEVVQSRTMTLIR